MNWKVAPRPGLALAHKRPPCSGSDVNPQNARLKMFPIKLSGQGILVDIDACPLFEWQSKTMLQQGDNSGLDQSVVSACSPCGARLCTALRRHRGTDFDTPAPAYRRIAGPLLSRLPSVNESDSSALESGLDPQSWQNIRPSPPVWLAS